DHHLGGHDIGLADAHPDAGPAIVSTRSLTFGVAAFGLIGGPLHILHVLEPRAAFAVAAAGGLASAVVAGLAFRTLGQESASGAVSLAQLVGREATVLVPC